MAAVAAMPDSASKAKQASIDPLWLARSGAGNARRGPGRDPTG